MSVEEKRFNIRLGEAWDKLNEALELLDEEKDLGKAIELKHMMIDIEALQRR